MSQTFRVEAFTFDDADELAYAIQVFLKGMEEKLTDEKVLDYHVAYTTYEDEGKRMFSVIVTARFGKRVHSLN